MVRALTLAVSMCAVQRGVAAQTVASSPAERSAKVVFVCEHGTVKSVVAVEHFNRLARARGLEITAVSRGTRPDSAMPSVVRRGLSADGFDVSLFQPRPFTHVDLASAILVVALDADVAPVVGKVLPVARWDGLPSVTADYDNGRRAIVAQVEKLVDSLARSRTGRRR